MNRRIAAASAWLFALAVVFPATAQTVSVKDSALAGVREELRSYDLTPQGTVAQLSRLSELARTLPAAEAAEAAFLRAAVASDLLFLSGYLNDDALRSALAAQLGVGVEALPATVQAELQATAHGVYREAALAKLAELEAAANPSQPPVAPFTVARDAVFLRAGSGLLGDPAVGARFAALARDPCAGTAACPPPYADFGPQGRRAVAYLKQLGAAAQRMARARGTGDPLAEALLPSAERDTAALRELTLRVPPRLPSDRAVTLPDGSAMWPAPDLVVVVTANELRFGLVPRVRLGIDGDLVRVPEEGVTFPETVVLRHNVPDTSPPTRSIEALVDGVRALRGDRSDLHGALVADAGVPSQYVARALVSLRKAGLPQLLLAAHTRDGALLGVPLRVVLPTVDGPGEAPDLKLRVRLGGYSLDVGRGTVDIPRVRDESGFHFDLAALRSAAERRAPKSAAVSFMSDVATEQVLLALFHVKPERGPVDLVIQ